MKSAIRELADTGVPVYFMHGNRDFMIGETFAAETGVTILNDPDRVDLYGENVLLSHGDALCTDDVQYQQVRAMTRNPDWQAMMLAKSIEERIAFACRRAKQSHERGESMSDEIMDVNQARLSSAQRARCRHPAARSYASARRASDRSGDRHVHRIVLGDWYEQGSVVRWDEDGPRLEA